MYAIPSIYRNAIYGCATARTRPKKGSAELLILSLLENRARHGYEIGQLIEVRSRGALRFNVASLYPLLYRLEKRGWSRGRWVEKVGQRRRRYYRLTPSARPTGGHPHGRGVGLAVGCAQALHIDSPGRICGHRPSLGGDRSLRSHLLRYVAAHS